MISADFSLAVALCRTVFDPAAQAQCIRLLPLADWDALVRVARRHRVEGLIWHALSALKVAPPPEAARPLAASAREIASKGLLQARETARLRDGFAERDVDLLFVKGLALGKLAYGNPFIKMGWDIDLLVREDQVGDAARLLEALDYRPTLPAGPVAVVERWHRRRKESVWRSRDDQHFVELHSRLADNRRLIPAIGMDSPRRLVAVLPGIELQTLAADETFAYLAVHGASSAWFRLKWINDFAALTHGESETEIERLYRRSQQFGAGRAAGQALLLAYRLYGTPVGDELRAELQSDRATRWLAASAMELLAARPDLREPTEVLFGTRLIHASQFALLPDLRFKATEAWRQLLDAV